MENNKEIEQLINYAVKEGYLDEDIAEQMTPKQKEDYYNKCMAIDPLDLLEE
jgi:hypothetical protein